MNNNDIYKQIEETKRSLARIDGLLHSAPSARRRVGLLTQRLAILRQQAQLSAQLKRE